MKRFLQDLFRLPKNKSPRPRAARTAVRPSLEALEDRCVPTVTNPYGGPVIPNAQVETLFVGQEWLTSMTPLQLTPVGNGINSFFQSLTNSPFMDNLGQYGVGRGSFGGWASIEWTNDPYMLSPMDDYHHSYSYGLTEAQQLIVDSIANGWLPAPNANRVYCVYLPPNEHVLSPWGAWNTDPSNGFFGYHNSFNSLYGQIRYALLPYPGGSNYQVRGTPTAFDSLCTTSSHELAEAVTDPTGQSWLDRSYSPAQEIGDICNNQIVYWDGYVVQKIANRFDQAMTPALPSWATSYTGLIANQTFYFGTLGTFQDKSTTVFGDTTAQPLGGYALSPSSFWVTINWGDGQTSAGTLVYNGNGTYSVGGNHAYASPGTYQISISVVDPYGMQASIDTTATVNAAPPSDAVVADLPGYGLYRWTATTGWQELTSLNAQSVATDKSGDVAAIFAGYGLYRWTPSGGWSQLTSFVPQSIAMDGSGDVAAVLPGFGLYRWTPYGGWVQLTSVVPQSIAADKNGDVTAVLAGYGLYRWTPYGGWMQLTPFVPQSIAMDASGDVAAVLPGFGLFRWTPYGGWAQLTSYVPQGIAMDASGDVAALFVGAGVYDWTPNTGWAQLTPYVPQGITADSSGDVFANFGGAGVYRWRPGIGWAQFISAYADMIAVSEF
jgi:hypothetical protein